MSIRVKATIYFFVLAILFAIGWAAFGPVNAAFSLVGTVIAAHILARL